MTPTQRKRLLRLADFIVTVPPEKFDMATYGAQGQCDTAACALGWCTVLFQRRGVKFLGGKRYHRIPIYKGKVGLGIGGSLFGLTYEQSEKLFDAFRNEGKSATQVRRKILRMVARLDKEKSDAT